MKNKISCIYCFREQEYEIDMKGYERNKILICENCNKRFRIMVSLIVNKYMVDENGKDLNKNGN